MQLLVIVAGVYASRPQSDRAMLFGVLTDTIRTCIHVWVLSIQPLQPKRVSLTTPERALQMDDIFRSHPESLLFTIHCASAFCDLQAGHNHTG